MNRGSCLLVPLRLHLSPFSFFESYRTAPISFRIVDDSIGEPTLTSTAPQQPLLTSAAAMKNLGDVSSSVSSRP
ncbi:hypothetical protein ACLOJK_001756 [Asimina triloba]